MMPNQDLTVTEGTVVRWLKKTGETVQLNEIVVEVETAKAVVSDFTVTPIVPANTAISLGLLEYRRGGYAKAVEWSRRCLAHPDYNTARFATAQFILAMSLRQLGDVPGARFQLAQGRNLIERKFEGGLDLGGAAQGFWFDWVYARILLREATTLIEGTPQSASLSAGVK